MMEEVTMEVTEDNEEVTQAQAEQVQEAGTAEEVKNPEAVLAELRRAQADLKSLRDAHKALEDERTKLSETLEGLKNGNPYKDKALTAETKLALRALGINDTDRLLPYVGTEGIDFADDGSLVGLSERIEKLKADLPELFDVKRRVGGKADIFANDAAEHKLDSTQMQVARIFGGN